MQASGSGIVKRSLKVAAIAVALVVAVIGIATILAEPFLNSATVKSGIERRVSEAFGLRFKINGKISLTFLPVFSVAAHDVTVSAGKRRIASAGRIEVTPRLPDLPISRVQLRSVAIHQVQVTFDRDVVGEVSSLTDGGSGPPAPIDSLVIESFAVINANLQYAGNRSGLEMDGLNFRGSRVAIIENRKLAFDDMESFVRTVRFNGNLSAKRIVLRDGTLTDFKMRLKAEKGILAFEPAELAYLGTRTKIVGHLDVRDDPKRLKILVETPGARVEKFLEGSENEGMIEGVINVKAELEAVATQISEMPNNLTGNLSVKGRNMTLRGVDLDKALTEFEKISGYGFSDLSALVLMGPLGLIVSHGYDQLQTVHDIMEASGDSTIQQVVSDWSVAGGVLSATDVAFSTQRYRVAIKGGLDFAKSRFDNITIAIVDSKGCILNSETVNGPFAEPEIKDSGVIQRTVIRPLKKFLDPKCKFFYGGSLPHPAGQ